MEYREIFLTLLRKYDETRQPKSYLKDLVETTHLYMRMLECFCKGRKNLMVQVSIPIKNLLSWPVLDWLFLAHKLQINNIKYSLLQKKRVKRRKSRGKKKTLETTPEALSETWKIVEEELRATGFQVSELSNQ